MKFFPPTAGLFPNAMFTEEQESLAIRSKWLDLPKKERMDVLRAIRKRELSLRTKHLLIGYFKRVSQISEYDWDEEQYSLEWLSQDELHRSEMEHLDTRAERHSAVERSTSLRKSRRLMRASIRRFGSRTP